MDKNRFFKMISKNRRFVEMFIFSVIWRKCVPKERPFSRYDDIYGFTDKKRFFLNEHKDVRQKTILKINPKKTSLISIFSDIRQKNDFFHVISK